MMLGLPGWPSTESGKWESHSSRLTMASEGAYRAASEGQMPLVDDDRVTGKTISEEMGGHYTVYEVEATPGFGPSRHRHSWHDFLSVLDGRPLTLALSALALAGLTLMVALAIGAPPTYAVAKRASKQRASLPPSCAAADLSLSVLGSQGATGHSLLGFGVTNTSTATCATAGYPRVQFLDNAGKPLSTLPAHTTRDFFGSAPLRRLRVAPGVSVSFRLGVTHGLPSTAGCTTAYGLQMNLPRETGTLRTLIPHGVYECHQTTVTPLQAGKSAYPNFLD